MPYKNQEIQKQYKREWSEKNHENIIWGNYLWHIENKEHKNELDKLSFKKHKNFYNWLARFKRKLSQLQKSEFLNTKNDKL